MGNKRVQKIIRCLATGFFISYLPPLVFKFKKNTGAGFLGTLLAVPFMYILPQDGAVIECCDNFGIAMAMTGIRLFHH